MPPESSMSLVGCQRNRNQYLHAFRLAVCLPFLSLLMPCSEVSSTQPTEKPGLQNLLLSLVVVNESILGCFNASWQNSIHLLDQKLVLTPFPTCTPSCWPKLSMTLDISLQGLLVLAFMGTSVSQPFLFMSGILMVTLSRKEFNSNGESTNLCCHKPDSFIFQSLTNSVPANIIWPLVVTPTPNKWPLYPFSSSCYPFRSPGNRQNIHGQVE